MALKTKLGQEFIFFDGAMGTMLYQAGLKQGELPEVYNITHPDIVKGIHQKYIEAGSDIVTTNTFQANDLKLKHSSYSVEEIVSAGVKVAKEAGAKYVALDIGPLGQLMEPVGDVSFREAYETFARQVKAGAEAGADLILFETSSDLYEAKAAILAAKEHSSLPIICTMTFQKNQRILLGADPLTVTMVLQALGVDALGVNCSLGPKELLPIVEEILKYAEVPVIVQPNAGLPKFDGQSTFYDLSSEVFAEHIKTMAQKGVSIFGGCCGTTPEFITAAKKNLTNLTTVKTQPERIICASSGRQTVILDKITAIGEPINITKASVRDIVSEAVKQKKAGAQIIRIDTGSEGIAEIADIEEVVKQIQRRIPLPIQFEGSNLEAVERGLRIYNGKPVINASEASNQTMEKILALSKKYGASVIKPSYS